MVHREEPRRRRAITPSGQTTEFRAGIAQGSSPAGIGFTNSDSNSIGRITPVGQVTEFQTGLSMLGVPFGIAAGKDGNMWFTGEDPAGVGRITPAGQVTEFRAGITAGSSPAGIALGADGDMWFTEPAGGRVARITPAGQVTEFSAGITPGSGRTRSAARRASAFAAPAPIANPRQRYIGAYTGALTVGLFTPLVSRRLVTDASRTIACRSG